MWPEKYFCEEGFWGAAQTQVPLGPSREVLKELTSRASSLGQSWVSSLKGVLRSAGSREICARRASASVSASELLRREVSASGDLVHSGWVRGRQAAVLETAAGLSDWGGLEAPEHSGP